MDVKLDQAHACAVDPFGKTDEAQESVERARLWLDEKLPRACRRVVTALLTDSEPPGGFIGHAVPSLASVTSALRR